MIALELVVTLVATLTALMLAILIVERNALRRTRLKHSLETLDLAKKLSCDTAHFNDLIRPQVETYSAEKKRSYLFSFRFFAQVLFGLAVFVGFAGWTYYLFKQELIGLATTSAVFALLGMVIPFVVWRGFKQRAEDIDRLFRGMEHYEKTLGEQDKANRQQQAAVVSVAGADEAPAVVAKAAEEKPTIPEDSILRRHYFAQLQAEKEALTNPYPTDSILRRHYDSTVKSQLTVELADDTAKPVQTVPSEASAVPEDSILRRHYLAQRQAEQEALTNPYPTDSILRRHYDTTAKSLLTAALSNEPEESVTTTNVESALQAETKTNLRDYKLRCHYTNQLRAKIEASLFPRPTDSVLRRHYDALVENEIENALPDWMREKNSSSIAKNLH